MTTLKPRLIKPETEPSIFLDNFEQYLQHFDLFQKNEPEYYALLNEIADEIPDIELASHIEKTALFLERYKKEYANINTITLKKIFIEEQIGLYHWANFKYERYGDYSNATFDKYQPVFVEALGFWRTELKTLLSQQTVIEKDMIKTPDKQEVTGAEKNTQQINIINNIGSMTTINKTEITSHNQSGGITGNHVTLDHESKQENIQNNNKEKKGDHWIGRVIMLIAAIVAILAYFKIDFS